MSASGIYFRPSYMAGSGRRFECDGFLRKLGRIHGYVISDITQFPRIPYWLVEAGLVRQWWDRGQLLTASKIPRARAIDLLRTVP